MTETIPFVNGIRLVPVTHVSIVLREMYGVSLSQSVSAWDITEFLRGAFSDSVFDVLIQAESVQRMRIMDSEEITVSFFTTLDSAESVVCSLDGRQTGISSRNVLVSASIVPPLPAQDEWEAAFHCHSEEEFSSLLPGCRPDTVVLSDIPIRWLGLKTPQLEKGSSSLRNLNAFFSHYGAVESVLLLFLIPREIQLLSSSEIDSFLYGTPDLEKNRYTLLPEKLNAPASFNLSFFVSKTSDLSESTKNKRNRKRQRDGAEAEEKAKPGSIGNHIYRRLNHSFIWSKKEDEMLMAMVLQFGTGWAFICSVFLLEEVNYRARLRRDCSMRWAFLEKNRDVISAAVPSEARFFLIPRYSLSHRKNEFAESVKLATSTAEASQRSDEAAQQTAEKVTSPLQALFTSVRTKAVDSALFEANALPASFEAKLKEVDSAFVAAEADPSALLRRYLRPDPPSSFKSTITKPAALRSPPAVGTLAMDAGNDTGKSQSGSVPIRPISVPRPPNVIELRHKAAEALPLAGVTFEDDTKFKPLLNPGRKPQENIIVPYPSALVDARRLLEEKNLVLPEVKEEPREPDAVSTGEPPFGLLPLELKELGDFGSLAGKDSVPLGLLGEEEEKEEAKEARRNELDDICCDDAPEEKKAATPLLTRDLPVQTPVPTPLAAPPAVSLHEPPFVEWVTEMSEATEDGVTGRKPKPSMRL